MGRPQFHIVKPIKEIATYDTYTVQLNLMEWGRNPQKYDLRHWVGQEPMKGICLTEDEARQLYTALHNEFGRK